MHFLNFLLTSTCLTQALALTVRNSRREFHLKTEVVPGQHSLKNRFANLYVTPYHTGAGFNAAALYSSPDNHAPAYLNYTERTVDGTSYHQVVYELYGTPYYLDVEVGSQPYGAWVPVEINVVKNRPQGFYFNDQTGLEFTATPSEPPNFDNGEFYGWIVCNWNLGAPLLFARELYNASSFPAPCSCADVYLKPEYI